MFFKCNYKIILMVVWDWLWYCKYLQMLVKGENGYEEYSG